MKNFKLIYGAALVTSMIMGIEITANTVTNIILQCTGDSQVCTQKAKLNAIGEEVKIDVSKYPPTFLGKISEEEALTLAMPEKQGEMVVYSFIPTAGDFAGQLVYIVFNYLVSRPGTRLAGKSVITAYRRPESAKPTDWTEIATLTFLAKNLKLEPIKVTLKPDGTAIWINVNTHVPEVFLFGKKDLTAEHRAAVAQEAAEKASEKATERATAAAENASQKAAEATTAANKATESAQKLMVLR